MGTAWRHNVRYFEADQQGVVFNMWYLGYFDEAMTAWLAERGIGYTTMMDAGYDLQLVHSEIDWTSSLRWPDEIQVEVTLGAKGRTSFALDFGVRGRSGSVARGRTVYVVVATDGSGKVPIPALLSEALGEPAA